MVVLLALLSVFRREGMYFFLLGPILLILAYWKDNSKKNAFNIIAIFVVIEMLFNIPIIHNGMKESMLAVDALIVHTLAEPTLDRDMAKPQLDIIGQALDIDTIDKWNTDYGMDSFDSNQFDVPGWKDNYYFIHIEDAKVSGEQYKQAFIELVKEQPIPFIISRIKAFLVAGRGGKSWSLYFPLMLMIAELVYSLTHFKNGICLLFLGVFTHIGLITLAMPASFFKYFFQMWLIGYTFLVIMIIDYNSKKIIV